MGFEKIRGDFSSVRDEETLLISYYYQMNKEGRSKLVDLAKDLAQVYRESDNYAE